MTVLGLAAQLQAIAQVDSRSIHADRLESRNSTQSNGRSLPKGSVTHLQRKGDCARPVHPIIVRLDPEIMRHRRSGEEPEQTSQQRVTTTRSAETVTILCHSHTGNYS